MKKANKKSNILVKMTLREIKNTFGRFFAVFAIIALGTGFFSGVRITTPVMLNTVNEYYRENSLYDYRMISTLGWEASEVSQLSEEEEVRSAEGSWQYDVICETKDGLTGVYKVHSITEDINRLELTEGKMPEAKNECLLDSENTMGLAVGDTIRFTDGNDPDTLDAFWGKAYKVTGLTKSSLYVNFERGTTSIGNGTVQGFMYLPKEAFCAEYYTEIYMKLKDDPVIYSDEYTEQMDDLRPEWEKLTQLAADNRYLRLYDDAKQELLDAQKEFDEKKAEGKQELADAEAELADGKKELDDAAKELADGKEKLDDAADELATGKEELDNAADELASGKEQLDANAGTLASAKAQLDSSKSQLDAGKKELDSNSSKLANAKKELDAAKKELDAGKKELDSAKAELASYDKQLKASKSQLDQASKELSGAKAVLDSTKAELDAAAEQLAAGKATLDATAAQLAQTKEQLDAAAAGLDNQQAELDAAYAAGLMDEESYAAAAAGIQEARAQIEAGMNAYNEGMAAYESGLSEYEAQKAQYDAGYAAYESGLAEYQAGLAEYEAGKAAYDQGLAEYNSGKAQYEKAKAKYDKGLKEYQAGLAEYNSGKAKYDKAMSEYNSGLAAYNSGLAQYNQGKAQYDQGVAEYESGLSAYNSAKSEYESGKAEYEQATKDYEEGLAEYQDGLAEYEDGLAEYEDAKQTFDEEIADAEEKLSDAEDELNDFEKPDTYLLERNTNIGYACFETDSQIVGQVARVLPIFFILVAVLVCMTTMTRMVDERRGQIGILKGLGYSQRDIMMTFLAYSGLAAVLGCIIGYAAGIVLFPSVIWYAYEMMYNNIPIRYIIDWKLAISVFLVSIISTLGTTYLSCRSELMESAASLMRPKAPKAGKRVFLEYIPAIWNRMKFMHKVSVRNILRYKRRFFMMVVGISGCTALLVTGFGLKDSIATFVDAQYDNIQVAEVEVVTDEADENDLPSELTEAMDKLGSSRFLYQQSSWDLTTERRVKSVTLIAPADWSDIDSFFRLRTMDGEVLPETGPGEALVSVSIAEHYGVGVGDELLLRNEDMEEIKATVTGVFENHVYDYVIMSRETVENAVGDYYVNGFYVNFPEGTDIYEAQAQLAACDSVIAVSVFADFRARIANMMSSLNYVVLLIILSAAALAFVVLYNLTNINIMERIREIATIKVLGFYRRETSDYVFRENMILTLIGMLVGLVLGVLLHGFVIDQIVVDMVYFKKEITPLSFLLSIILTFSFTFIVNQIMTIKLEKINMAESLKSVE